MGSQRAVVVTGASSGIGEATALRLALSGTRVFAGVRRDEDGAALVRRAGANLVPLALDVTEAPSIAAARERVTEALAGAQLSAVVNNAGIAVAGPLEVLPLDALRRQFEVNVFGALAVTQAFLPLLRASRGRIVNVSSIGGKSASPFVGAYCASKHALEALSDALRMELRQFGIRVCIIEPGRVRTPIWERSSKASRERLNALAPDTIAPYQKSLSAMLTFTERAHTRGSTAERVAQTIERALTDPRPRARYLIGTDARMQLALARLPEPLRDRIFAAVLRT
jgi:NAD(P)-dependent dehydrogenase (short-subunit alcohol dehydrogenase family)